MADCWRKTPTLPTIGIVGTISLTENCRPVNEHNIATAKLSVHPAEALYAALAPQPAADNSAAWGKPIQQSSAVLRGRKQFVKGIRVTWTKLLVECYGTFSARVRSPLGELSMRSCAAQIFSDITPEKWLSLQNKATQNGINLAGDVGQTTQHGCTFQWKYESSSATLTIQCLDHPLLAPCGTINGRIHDLMDGTEG